MQISITRDELLKPLGFTAGVVERRQTLPVLSNVLVQNKAGKLFITGTDLEIEVVAEVAAESVTEGEVTLPARKLLDICKALPDNSKININIESEKAVVKSGKSRFSLVTMPATEFPNIETSDWDIEFSIPQGALKKLLEKTQFCMAQQDVRYYLNGLLIEINNNTIKAVGTDGHRMGVSEVTVEGINAAETTQIIVPRKGILELGRFLEETDAAVTVKIGKNHIRADFGDLSFTSKLIDGRFPDYTKVIPSSQTKSVALDKQSFRQAIQRVSILSNEKYKGIRIGLEANLMNISAHNPEQEEAQEEIVVDYNQEAMEIGFNSTYIVDAANALPGDSVDLGLTDSNSSGTLTSKLDKETIYVVMPMRL
ncbi:MAG: DNA polymerase III subunit beta [Proteobacteria bacterium]|nr:DNA polymerase III subunit beta [Pseudomonadota bacterium]